MHLIFQILLRVTTSLVLIWLIVRFFNAPRVEHDEAYYHSDMLRRKVLRRRAAIAVLVGFVVLMLLASFWTHLFGNSLRPPTP